MSVTGLDLLIVTVNFIAGQKTDPDMEWWGQDQVASWADSFLWVPHHVASLVCNLLAVLLLELAIRQQTRKDRWCLATLSALSLAGGLGLSVYVAVATGILLALWTVQQALQPEQRVRVLKVASYTLTLAALISLPYVVQLLGGGGTGGRGGAPPPLTMGIRQILNLDVLTSFPFLRSLSAIHPWLFKLLGSLLLLPVGYGLELGFFGAILLLALRHRDAPGKKLLFFIWTGLAASSFFRSTVIATNDYAIRATLLPQFFLLLLAVEVIQRASVRGRRWLVGLALIGVCGTIYQLVELRVYLPWQVAHGNPDVGPLGAQNYVLRQLYSLASTRIPATARIQYDPHANPYLLRAHLIHIGHQVITADENCNTAFGGEQAPCAAIQGMIQRIFPAPDKDPAPLEEVVRLCSKFGIDDLVATRWDSVWQTPTDWVWRLPLIAEVPGGRIVRCAQAPR
jgi:hypothetical protein